MISDLKITNNSFRESYCKLIKALTYYLNKTAYLRRAFFHYFFIHILRRESMHSSNLPSNSNRGKHLCQISRIITFHVDI